MAQEVRYVTTSDGVQIGYVVSGSGPVVVVMPDIGFSSMLFAERDLPEVAAWAEAVSRRFTYVRYDARGFGYSQPRVPDMSRATWHRDLEAVVAAVGATNYALFGWLGTARIAVEYAAAHQEEVSHLVAWPPDYPVLSSPEGDSLESLAMGDWETFTETYAHVVMGWENSERARRLAAHWRETVTQNLYARFLIEFRWPSVGELVRLRGRIVAPTLVLARRHRYATDRIAALAALQDVRVVVLAGDEALPYQGDVAEVIDAMAAFVSDPASFAASGAMTSRERAAKPPSGVQLTRREQEVLDLLALGKSNGEIADALVISVRTVERHLMRIYGKLGASGKSARVIAAAHAILQMT